MADKIQIKGGKGSVPRLSDREPAYSKDEKALYIGTDGGNVKVGDGGWEARITALENAIKDITARLDALGE